MISAYTNTNAIMSFVVNGLNSPMRGSISMIIRIDYVSLIPYIKSMMVVARDRDYPELLEEVRGKRVLIWTCNTCARLCNGVGGSKAAESLAGRLSRDGVNVCGVLSTSASCIDLKVAEKASDVSANDVDVLISLTCSVGSDRASVIFQRPSINPIETFGFGYLSGEGEPTVIRDGKAVPLGEISSRASPY